MRLRPHRRDLVIWSPSTCRAERGRGLWFTRSARPRRIRTRMRTLGLLAAIGLIRLGAAARPRWRPLLRSGAPGIVMIPGMLSLLSALLVPVDPVTAGPRRRELERELAAYSTPDQRCDLEAIFDRYPDSATGELREILTRQAAAAAPPPSAVSSPYG
jgi:hypothetical protein